MNLQVKLASEENYKWVRIISINEKGSDQRTVPLGFAEGCWILIRCCRISIPGSAEMFASLNWSWSSTCLL